MKLSSRLSLVVTGVSAVVLLASFVTAYFSVDFDERRELDLALLVQARGLAEQSLVGGGVRVIDGTASVPESLKQYPYYVAIYSEQGEVIASTRNLGDAVPSPAAFDLVLPVPEEGETFNMTIGDVALRAVAVRLPKRAETLVYAVPSRSIDKDAEFLRRTFALLFFAAVLITWLFSRWLGGRLARDVHRIASVAREVATGDLRARVGASAQGSEETAALARDLDAMIEQLGQLIDIQRVFVSHAAHELRSPLTSLRGELQLALRRPRTSEEYRTTIARITEDVESLISLAEDLLALARAEAPATERTVDTQVLVSRAIHAARGLAELGQVIVEAQVPPDLMGVKVRGAEGDLARALRNLVDNAIEHSPPGGTVRIDVQKRGENLQISVEDRGPGVAPQDISGIFEPFYRAAADQGKGRPGTGLGLPIARRIVQASDGDIVLDQSYSPGARFVITLPIAPEGAPRTSLTETKAQVSSI